jgi:protein-L-isoaspartate(D-aspartate) O-methyltransferase
MPVVAGDYEQGVRVTETADVPAAISQAAGGAIPDLSAGVITQAGIRPGMRVLEIGCGGGHSAALLAMATGPGGHVVAMDHDRAMTERAIAYLRAAGCLGWVTVLTGDGEHGAPGHAPFDAIIAAGGAWDIPAAWAEQLADGGILVVPAGAHRATLSIAFRKASGHLVSFSAMPRGLASIPVQPPALG